MDSTLAALRRHQQRLARCTRCPKMIGPPVMGYPVVSPVMLVGQAPGAKEIERRRPFAWTAGKTLFGWFRGIGLDEEGFRRRVYMAAVCRCFPGKNSGGGDRVPDRQEVENCTAWLAAEFQLLRPRLVIPAGKLAIGLFLPVDKLDAVVGRLFKVRLFGFETDVVPLPHPSGASPWHRTEPGRALLHQALARIAAHPAWGKVCGREARRAAD
ncbi:MAG: uracil-DNA glycosylase [Burkholderiales bacterium]|nr:MAG: uracil-DNA glycosylase [Burkholderiales bacterium]